MSKEAYPYIVRGAKIFCTYGSHIRYLDMPVCHGSYIREKPMMHKRDCKVGLDANIPPFGACISPENTGQEIIIHDAENILPLQDENGELVMPPMPISGRLCIPMLDVKWCDAHEDTLVDGVPALTVNSTITCSLGGVICFFDDGQEV